MRTRNSATRWNQVTVVTTHVPLSGATDIEFTILALSQLSNMVNHYYVAAVFLTLSVLKYILFVVSAVCYS